MRETFARDNADAFPRLATRDRSTRYLGKSTAAARMCSAHRNCDSDSIGSATNTCGERRRKESAKLVFCGTRKTRVPPVTEASTGVWCLVGMHAIVGLFLHRHADCFRLD
jgi:hypothetical protein